jgi:hypothetical protein
MYLLPAQEEVAAAEHAIAAISARLQGFQQQLKAGREAASTWKSVLQVQNNRCACNATTMGAVSPPLWLYMCSVLCLLVNPARLPASLSTCLVFMCPAACVSVRVCSRLPACLPAYVWVRLPVCLCV